MLGDRKTVILRGGAPWGFRLSGGGQTPVYIAKVRSRSKAAYGGLAAGDTIVSVNGISSSLQSLREINDIIDTVRDQLIIEVQSTGNSRGFRLDSSSSIDTRENSPVRSLSRLTPQPKQQADYYQYPSSRTTPTYSLYSSTSNTNHFDNTNSINREQRYTDSYGRSVTNPLPSIFRTATITTNSPQTPIAKARVQQFSFRPSTSNSTYDTPRSMTNGYVSDTNEFCRSTISVRPTNGPTATTNVRHVVNQQSYVAPSKTVYNTKISTGNEQNYYSDSEYVTSGPRYYKITRLVNTSRRPSNVVLPIRSITSRAYDQYVPPEPVKPQQQQQQQQQQPFDVYRYQLEQQRLEREREQRERERQEQLQRQLYQQRQTTAVRFNPPPKLTLPSETTIDREIGAELLISPVANKKRYNDSSFYQNPYNTYPTIDEQKKMAHKIASILESGDPTEKGTSKFEKQRQRADKFAIEADAAQYRPLRPLQTDDFKYSNQQQTYSNQQQTYSNQQQTYHHSSNIPNCIKHSLDEAQYINPLRYVGAPEEFKQMHMQEHVTHTNVSPFNAMSLVDDLNQSRGKGAALFQKRKARSEKWVIDENNVKKQGYRPPPPPPSSNNNGPIAKPWGQRAPSWSDSEGPGFSPVRTTFNPSPAPVVPALSEPILSPSPPVQSGPRFGDFNAKPKGFGSWNAENSSPRVGNDTRKPLNLNIEPSIREGIAESHTRNASQPWSPPYNPQSIFSPNQQQQQTNTNYFNYPSWNQPKIQEQYNGYNQRNTNNISPNPYSSTQQQQQHFTDL
ncbi:unnamed protein product [Adineta steineri]|uniref:PDZ domain-containing protein n=1 Tax=Adineta steineri TaxID=433720 RepID=A0A819AFH2_9BILA|nr:unnamed protein product [Adineta steineri]CAF3781297.1 unnamed protein product [Adineta steineri]